MDTLNVKIKKLNDLARIPMYATDGSAAADLYAALSEPMKIMPGERVLIPTGISIDPGDSGVVSIICARSGLAFKKGIGLANGIGVVDSDYRGEVKVALINNSSEEFTVENGERIAQIMFMPVLHAAFEEADELCDTDRGQGGFGSTGTK
jgi:dUTP pyrophosphatase